MTSTRWTHSPQNPRAGPTTQPLVHPTGIASPPHIAIIRKPNGRILKNERPTVTAPERPMGGVTSQPGRQPRTQLWSPQSFQTKMDLEVTPFGAGQAPVRRRIVALAVALGIALDVSGCATGGADGVAGSTVPLSQSNSTTPATPKPSAPATQTPSKVVAGTTKPQQPSVAQSQRPSVAQPQPPSVAQPQPPSVPEPAPSLDAGNFDPPVVTVKVPSNVFFTSPIVTATVYVNVTSSVGVPYVNVTFTGPMGQSQSGAFLSSGTSKSGTWISNSTLQCSQFRAGGTITIRTLAGDLNGNVSQGIPTSLWVGYGSGQSSYDPATNTKAVSVYVCP